MLQEYGTSYDSLIIRTDSYQVWVTFAKRYKSLQWNTMWSWHEIHDHAVKKIKRLVTSEHLLSFYELNKDLTLQCASSKTRLGVAFLESGKAIASASRTLTGTETRYTQIEKEIIAFVVWLEKFYQYNYGQDVTIQSNHKQLEIIKKTHWTQHSSTYSTRMLLRLQKYSTKLECQPWKEMHLANTIKQAYFRNNGQSGALLNEMVHFAHLQPTLVDSLQEIRNETCQGSTLSELIHVIIT